MPVSPTTRCGREIPFKRSQEHQRPQCETPILWLVLATVSWGMIEVGHSAVLADEQIPSEIVAVERQQLVSFTYRSDGGEERTLAVLRESLYWNREQTLEERTRWLERLGGHPKNDSFQHAFGGGAFWVVDRRSDESTENARVVGAAYYASTSVYCTNLDWAADIVWHPAREQYLLVLANSLKSRLTVAVFPLDLEARLNVKAPTLTGRRDWNDRPKPMQAIAELRTELPVFVGGSSCCGLCGITALRAMPDERGLMLAAIPRSRLCEPFLFRYQFRERKWMGLEIKDGAAPEKTDRDKILEARGETLDPPPEAGDPDDSRRTKPPKLKPIPDPR